MLRKLVHLSLEERVVDMGMPEVFSQSHTVLLTMLISGRYPCLKSKVMIIYVCLDLKSCQMLLLYIYI
ncbi:hypothetical protein RHMOL_Rhmol09G0220800 [Rhododendron molle]|uniref:Uncharacterized protein n=1 Tax=Rhododendron molle TaxID=49168 RepID=A0ACC0MFU4_RHOML|nr:hypothetical protein RHMOL_Rhmol09G0220800 [Rhododendron molle]